MPLLRNLTTKIKTKLTPLELSPATSPSSVSSFEVVSREKRPQSQRANTGSSVESFACVDARGVDARAIIEELEKVKLERGDRRRSKFREEL